MSAQPATSSAPSTVDVRSRTTGIALLSAGAISVQFGAAVAITLFDRVGATGAVTLRLVIAMLLLLLGTAAYRALRRNHQRLTHGRTDYLLVIAFGISLAAMNLSFYESAARIPLGPAVSVELMGPLVLSAVMSRRAIDFVFVGVAVLGVITLGLGEKAGSDMPITLVGVFFAALAGAFWAAYILLSARVGARFARTDGLTLAMIVAAVLVLPFGLAHSGGELLSGGILWRGVVIAVLSSGLPYSLDLFALRRITPAMFGVLMSLEPAIAAIAALLVVGQELTAIQVVGLAAVVLACAGVTVFGPRPKSSSPVDDRAALDPC